MEDQNLGINVYWSSAGTPITPTRILAHWYGEGKNYISNRAESCDDQFRSSSEFDHSQSEHEMQEVSKKQNGTKSPHEKNVLHNGHGSNLKRDFVNRTFKTKGTEKNEAYESDASTSNCTSKLINAKHTDCANFTQMLWKSSLQVGIALSCSSNGRTVAVALFQPKGNLMGQYYENLPRSESLESFDSYDSTDFCKSHNYQNNENFREECLRTHNKLRALHGAPPLRLSKPLCK